MKALNLQGTPTSMSTLLLGVSSIMNIAFLALISASIQLITHLRSMAHLSPVILSAWPSSLSKSTKTTSMGREAPSPPPSCRSPEITSEVEALFNKCT